MRIGQITLGTCLAFAALITANAPAQAEDGYELWLRYRPSATERVNPYRAHVSQLVATTRTPTQAAARTELLRGLGGLLAAFDVRARDVQAQHARGVDNRRVRHRTRGGDAVDGATYGTNGSLSGFDDGFDQRPFQRRRLVAERHRAVHRRQRRIAVAFFARGGENRPAVIATAARAIYDTFGSPMVLADGGKSGRVLMRAIP